MLRDLTHLKHLQEDVLYSWINPAYLEESTQKTIRKKFGTDSEIELESFLTEEKYEALSTALKDQGLKWKRTGPADKNSYQVCVLNCFEESVSFVMGFYKIKVTNSCMILEVDVELPVTSYFSVKANPMACNGVCAYW